jgi:hypothetical protein
MDVGRLGPLPWSKNGRHIVDAKGRLVAEASDPWLALGIVEAVNEQHAKPKAAAPPPPRAKKLPKAHR